MGNKAARSDRPTKRYVVARSSDIPDGERILVQIKGRSVGVFNVQGRFFALLNRCPHHGGELCRGEVLNHVDSSQPGEYLFDPDKKLIACPWHGWEFDMITGESWFDPLRTKARPFSVDLEAGADVKAELEAGTAEPAADAASGSVVDGATKRIKGPYKAEVVPVTVEEDYIVISLQRR
jgi:3-phenylpropionate/trans-cinnamate dioxygenase ferredoxin subunit